MTSSPSAGPIRHPISQPALEAYLSRAAPAIALPLTIRQFGFGQSNPTYLLTSSRSGARYVLRKKPPGKVLSAAAHKVEREYRVLKALGGGGGGGGGGEGKRTTDVPVPRVYCLCEDQKVLGTPFYVMEFLDGRIFEDPAMLEGAGEGITAEARRKLWLAAAETLARLHRVDVKAVGLEGFGGGGGGGSSNQTGQQQQQQKFYTRQVRTWREICARQARTKDVDTGEEVGPLPHFEELMAFFGDEEKQPVDRARLIHGDYKIDNLVYGRGGEERVIGILDWEMSTIGHPLSDLANLLNVFRTATMGGVSSTTTSTDALPSIASHAAFRPGNYPPGLPSPSDVLDAYFAAIANDDRASPEETDGQLTLRRRRELAWAEAFTMFRQAAICQGIAARQAARQASSARAEVYAALREPFAREAWRLVGELMGEGGKARL